MTKTCRHCHIKKPSDGFYKTSGNTCRLCHTARSVAHHKANPIPYQVARKKWWANPENRKQERLKALKKYAENKHKPEFKAAIRAKNLKSSYGITVEDFDRMASEQNYKCKLCGDEEMPEFHVDHNHETGAVRGLLCGNCNTGIGLLQESPALFERAARYVADRL